MVFEVHVGERLAAYAQAESAQNALEITSAYYRLSRGAVPAGLVARAAEEVPLLHARHVSDYGFSWLPNLTTAGSRSVG